jgi:ABC-2 type transport system ATP-binding protein
MKMEIVGGLLHQPRVLFLDEPTLGLDVTMQKRIRAFFAAYNQSYGGTLLLTSHYMADVVALCQRVIVIHHGRILFDGGLAGLVDRFTAHKTIGIRLDDTAAVDLSPYGEVVGRDEGRVVLRVPRAEASRAAARLLADLPVADLTIEDPPIEDIIAHVFSLQAPEAAAA